MEHFFQKRIDILTAGFTPTYAALWGIAAAYGISFFRKDTRLSLKDLIDTFEEGARSALSVIAACACAGIIVVLQHLRKRTGKSVAHNKVTG